MKVEGVAVIPKIHIRSVQQAESDRSHKMKQNPVYNIAQQNLFPDSRRHTQITEAKGADQKNRPPSCITAQDEEAKEGPHQKGIRYGYTVNLTFPQNPHGI